MQASCQHTRHICQLQITFSPRYAAGLLPGTFNVRSVRGSISGQKRRCPRMRAAEDEQAQRMQEMAQQMQQNPEMKSQMEQMQKMMSDPNAQAQMQQQMAAAMQSPEVQQRMAALQEDPEIMEVLNKAKSGGLGSMMQLMQDQSFMEKVGRKMGGMGGGGNPLAAAAAPPPAAAAAPPAAAAPDINDLLDAAKYGDLEATEDLIAVNKDIDQRDADQRTPLHYAVAYNHPDIMHQLLDAGANLEAADSKGNTPLHYAAGYGRADVISSLLEAGCNGRAANGKGHTPYELVKMDANNPIQSDPDIVQLLEKASSG